MGCRLRRSCGNALHPTMYLLIHSTVMITADTNNTLHPTMYLLIHP